MPHAAWIAKRQCRPLQIVEETQKGDSVGTIMVGSRPHLAWKIRAPSAAQQETVASAQPIAWALLARRMDEYEITPSLRIRVTTFQESNRLAMFIKAEAIISPHRSRPRRPKRTIPGGPPTVCDRARSPNPPRLTGMTVA